MSGASDQSCGMVLKSVEGATQVQMFIAWTFNLYLIKLIYLFKVFFIIALYNISKRNLKEGYI